MPLLKLQHAHVSTYQELFVMWNSKVRRRPAPRAQLALSGCRNKWTEHRAPPHHRATVVTKHGQS